MTNSISGTTPCSIMSPTTALIEANNGIEPVNENLPAVASTSPEVNLAQMTDEDILNALKFLFAKPGQLDHSDAASTGFDDCSMMRLCCRSEWLSPQGRKKILEFLQSELKKYKALLNHSGTGTRLDIFEKKINTIIIKLIINSFFFMFFHGLLKKIQATDPDTALMLYKAMFHFKIDSSAKMPENLRLQITWYYQLLVRFIHQGYSAPLIHEVDTWKTMIQNNSFNFSPEKYFDHCLLIQFCDYCNNKQKVPQFIFKDKDIYDILLEIPPYQGGLDFEQALPIPNLTLLLDESKSDVLSSYDLQQCLTATQNHLPIGHQFKICEVTNIKERIENAYTYMLKVLHFNHFYQFNQEFTNKLRIRDTLSRAPLLAGAAESEQLIRNDSDLFENVSLCQNLEEFKACKIKEFLDAEWAAAAAKRVADEQTLQECEAVQKALLEEYEEEKKQAKGGRSRRSLTSANKSQGPHRQSEIPSVQPTKRSGRAETKAPTPAPNPRPQLSLSTSAEALDHGTWKMATTRHQQQKHIKDAHENDAYENLLYLRRNAYNALPFEHVGRWRRSKGNRQMIRDFSDRIDGQIDQRYKDMRDSQIDQQYYSHYVPGLSSLIGMKFLKKYAREVNPPKGHFESRSYQCAVRLEAPELGLDVYTYMTLGLKNTGEIYHCYIHSEAQRSIGATGPIPGAQIDADNKDIAATIEKAKDYIIQPKGEKIPIVGEQEIEGSIQAFEIEGESPNIPAIQLRSDRHTITIYPLKSDHQTLHIF